MTIPHLTIEAILEARRDDLTSALQRGRALRPGSAWLYHKNDDKPGIHAMLLRSSKLDLLVGAARKDGVLANGLAAISWTPLVAQTSQFVWIWVELRGVGGAIYMAPVVGDYLGEWLYQLGMPPFAIPVAETDTCPHPTLRLPELSPRPSRPS